MFRRSAVLLCAAGCLLALAPSPAAASTTLSTSIENPNDGPFAIISCNAVLADTEFGNVDYYFRPAAQYLNTGSKRIIAVKVLFVLRNSFDEELDQEVGLDDDGLRAGTTGKGNWEWINLASAARKVQCYPYQARFSDGTTWTNDFKTHARPKPRRTPAPAPAPPQIVVTTPSRAHPPTCRVTLADKSHIDIPWDNPGCANARKAFVARTPPATCSVRLADGRSIEIPWNNAGCADARKAWLNGGKPPAPAATAAAPQPEPSGAPAAAPLATVDYEALIVEGHPATCIVREDGNVRHPLWASEECEHARATWAAAPSYMRESLWDTHDGAPENLDNGHPKFCTAREDKTLHFFWNSVPCKNARLKWEAIHPKA